MQFFLDKLHLVAHEPLTYVAFLVLIGAWVWRAYFLRTKNYIDKLDKLPARDQLSGLQLLALGYPQKVTRNQLKLLQQRYFLIAFIATLVSLIVLAGLVVHYWSQPLNESNERLKKIERREGDRDQQIADISKTLRSVDERLASLQTSAASYRQATAQSDAGLVPDELLRRKTELEAELTEVKQQLADYASRYGSAGDAKIQSAVAQAEEKVQTTERLLNAVTLRRSFVAQYKDRATIESQFIVDHVSRRPNPPHNDGDLHIAGRDRGLGFVIVAELMNAKDQPAAVQLLHEAEGQAKPLNIAGVWRLWFEHAGGETQIQGDTAAPAMNTNPFHVLELHPVTRVDGIATLQSFQEIIGFAPKPAEQAFAAFEQLPCKVAAQSTAISLTSQKIGFNYVAFTLESIDTAQESDDALLLNANIHALDGKLLVKSRRLIAVKGTPPAESIKRLRPGGRLTVLGIPRINLNAVERLAGSASTSPTLVTQQLPYEMIVAALQSAEE